MYSLTSKTTSDIINAALLVYNELGYGFLEASYSKAMQYELTAKNLRYEVEKPVIVWYKNTNIGRYYIDLLVNDDIIIELKTTQHLIKAHFKQVQHYMCATKIKTGFIFNFGPEKLTWHRVFV